MQRPAPEPVPIPAEELQVVLAHLLRSQETQRRQLARQLHDELGQVLAMLKIKLTTLVKQPGAAGLRLEDCLDLLQRAVNQARLIALEARPALLDDLGLVPALRWLVQTKSAGTGLTATVTADPESPVLSLERRSTCFRVAEEAVNNVLRHAQAKTLRIEFRQHEGALNMAIRDDGCGFEVAEHAAGGGLLTMRIRVRLAGGEFVLQSQHGTGTEVRVRFVGGD
jgi:signal transduction histidine kinase